MVRKCEVIVLIEVIGEAGHVFSCGRERLKVYLLHGAVSSCFAKQGSLFTPLNPSG
jgi:hypothetical protein